MNYYSFHIGDYRRDTGHLTLLEHGVYRQLIDMYYLSENGIPAETEVVYRRLCAKTDEEKKAVNTILSEFFVLENDWQHERCNREIKAYNKKAELARTNGKSGGRPPKTKAVISRLLEETQEKANQEPLTNNHKPITNKDIPQAAAKKTKTKLDEHLELPGDWKQSALDHWEKKNRPDLTPEDQFEKFKNHHVANGTKMENWKAAWRTWYSNAVQFTKPSGIIQPVKQPYKPQWFPGIGLD